MADEQPKVGVDHLNRTVKAGYARALELEPRLADLIEPLLVKAGDQAAANFRKYATDHLNASAHRADLARCAVLGSEGVRAMFPSLILAASGPDHGGSNSTMIALKPLPEEAERLAQVDGCDPDTLHVTLAYLGQYDGDLDELADAIGDVARSHGALSGKVGGIGSFDNNGNGFPSILLPSCPGLIELRVAVTEALVEAGFDYGRQHGYLPHLTVGYEDSEMMFPNPDSLSQDLHFDDLWIVRGDTDTRQLPLDGMPPLTASAFSDGGIESEIAAVAEERRPESGYGDTWWNEETKTVFWCGADWTTTEESDAAEEAFLAIDGVENFDWDAEVSHPDGRDGWEKVWSPTGLTAAGEPTPWTPPAGDEVIDVNALMETLRGKTDPVRRASIEAVMTPALAAAGLSFDVTNPFADKVLSQSASQITEIAETTQLNVMRIIAASHEQGLSIPATAKAIQAGMAEAAPARATLIARTELVGAVNGGSLAATQIVSGETGDAYNKVWLTAPGAQYPRHEDYDGLDGQTTSLQGFFEVGEDQLQYPGDPAGSPEEVCNCFPADTLVDRPGLRAMWRRRYDGDLVKILLSSGDEISATPNHPVLRLDGKWMPLGEIEKGDHLVCATICRDETGAPDPDRPVSKIGELYDLADIAGDSKRVRLTPPDLHGAGVDGEVDVVRTNGSLILRDDSPSDEEVAQLGLTLAYAASACLRGSNRPLLRDHWDWFRNVAGCDPTSRVRIDDEKSALVLIESRHPELVGFLQGSNGKPQFGQSSDYEGTTHSEIGSDRQNRLAVRVSPTEVLLVKRYEFHGDVYTLDSGFGWFTAGSLVARNCRCTLVYEDAQGNDVGEDDSDS